jgi:periplasmic protein TonB
VRRAIVASGIAAIGFHALLLFGLHVDQPAVPLPPAADPIVVGLVAAAPRPGPAENPAATAPEPEQPKPSEPRNTTRPERPAKKPVRKPTEPAPRPKANVSERRDPVAETAPAADGASDSSQPAGSESGSAAASAPSGGSPAGGREVSSLPRYRNTPAPKYPPAARREHQEGVVLLAVDVGANGRPTGVVVKKSSGVAILDEAAVTAVRRWSFEPARSAGLPVASTVEVPVRFSLAD